MKLNNLDLNKLAIFSRIVEAGNYRLASEQLNVTPSALSQTISSLEHTLGVPLFHRLGKKLVLTEMGAQIQKEFQLHHSQLLASLSRLGGKADQVTGLLHVGAYLEFARFQLAPVLADFQRKHPSVQVKLVFDTPSRLQRLLETRKLDCCFSIYPERDSRLLESRPIYQGELLLAAPKGQLSERASYEEVIASPMIEYYFNHQPIRRWLWLHYRKKPKHLPIRTYASTAEMVLALVEQGLGIGMVPEFLLRASDARTVSVCRPSSRKLIDHIWMLQLKAKQESPALAALTEAVERGLGA